MALVRDLKCRINQLSLRTKVFWVFIAVVAFFLYRMSFSSRYYMVSLEGQDRVTHDLQGAHQYLYRSYIVNFRYLTKALGVVSQPIDKKNLVLAHTLIGGWDQALRPDIFFLMDLSGRVVYSKNNPHPDHRVYSNSEVVRRALDGAGKSKSVEGFEVLGENILAQENLAQKALIEVKQTPDADSPNKLEERQGLAYLMAIPVVQNSKVQGILVLGKLFNNDPYLVDEIAGTYDVRATLFLNNVRIATNVPNEDGERAIGTLLSKKVQERVLKQGEKYQGRAFVVNDWYITAYEPIRDINKRVIGALYVGTLEAPLLKRQQMFAWELRLTLLAGVLIFTMAIGYIYRLVIKPVQRISGAALALAQGKLGSRIKVKTHNHCWEVMNCSWDDCVAFGQREIKCWLMEGTPCTELDESAVPKSTCLKCPVHRETVGNEVDRLSDVFNYMAASLEERATRLLFLNHELENKNLQLQESLQALDDSQDIIYALALAVEAKDSYTRGHSERVAEYSVCLAKRVGLSEEERDILRGAAILHDIGKIGIAGGILRKPALLSAIEFQQVRKHPATGERICSTLKFAREMLPIIRHHHEHYNGHGYPDGLKGQKIPLAARIVAVADAYDAMTSDRPYRSGLPPEEALRRLDEGAGAQWDPELVPVFIKYIRELAADGNLLPNSNSIDAVNIDS